MIHPSRVSRRSPTMTWASVSSTKRAQPVLYARVRQRSPFATHAEVFALLLLYIYRLRWCSISKKMYAGLVFPQSHTIKSVNNGRTKMRSERVRVGLKQSARTREFRQVGFSGSKSRATASEMMIIEISRNLSRLPRAHRLPRALVFAFATPGLFLVFHGDTDAI